MMRRLKVDMASLEMAFEASEDEGLYYLDLESGDILCVTDDGQHDYDALIAEAEAAGIGAEEALTRSGLQDWEKEAVSQVLRVEQGLGASVIEIPQEDSREGYRDMEAFTESLKDSPLKGRLVDALAGGRPFRRFKDVLVAYPEDRERWFAFEQERVRRRIREWLDDEGIELLERQPAPSVMLSISLVFPILTANDTRTVP